MTIIKQRTLVGTLCGACIVTLVALCFSAAPARAQQNYNPLPPQVAFISNGKFTGTLQIQGNGPFPIKGSIAYLTGDIEYLRISVVTETGQQLTSDSWEVETTTVINEWEVPVSTFPTTCLNEVLTGASYPQCTPWTPTNVKMHIYSQECTVTAQGNKTTLKSSAQLSSDNKLVKLQLNANSTGDNSQGTDFLTITMTSQGTTPPVPSDFNRPNICNAPTAYNPSENDQGNEPVCTGTIPSICF